LGTTLKKWANLFVTTIGATATRVTKGWFTDLEVTNMPTVNGTSIASTFENAVSTVDGVYKTLGSDPSKYREFSYTALTSGDLYTLMGNICTNGWSHNANIDASGNFLGRDATGACQMEVHAGTTMRQYYAASNTAGVVPTWTLKATYTFATGGYVLADGFSTSTLTSTVATGTAPLTVTSTTPVANLNIGGNSATATTAPTTAILVSQATPQTLGVTGERLTKLWATDIESTNMPTVGGTSLASTFAPIASPTFTGTVTAPTIELLAGTASIAPLNFTAGTNTTSVVPGAVEFD
jgi:hypothetical protein